MLIFIRKMRNHDIQNTVNRFTHLILILFIVFVLACTGRVNKLDSSNMIPEKELPSLITDLYLSDGLLSLVPIRNMYDKMDSTSCYREVIERHGYTKDAMDKTMKYYFIKKPKQLIKIYDQVLAKLSEMDSRFEKETSALQSKITNYWTGKSFYSFPDPSGKDSTHFEMTVPAAGLYKLTFTVTLYPDDQSLHSRITVYTCHPDSIETGERHYLKTLNYIKDGMPHTYVMYVKASNKSDFHLRGLLYDFDNYLDGRGKHLRIEKISYTAG